MQESYAEECNKLKEIKAKKGGIKFQENKIELCNSKKQKNTKKLCRRAQVNDAEEGLLFRL